MSEAVIYKRLRATTRIVGSTLECFTPKGEWVRTASLLPGVKLSTRGTQDAFDTYLRKQAARAAASWTERQLNGLQDAADRLEENFGPARRRWIAALLKAREAAGQDAPVACEEDL